MKKFIATYYIPKTKKYFQCDVFAMSEAQAYEMYQRSFMDLIGLEESCPT